MKKLKKLLIGTLIAGSTLAGIAGINSCDNERYVKRDIIELRSSYVSKIDSLERTISVKMTEPEADWEQASKFDVKTFDNMDYSELFEFDIIKGSDTTKIYLEYFDLRKGAYSYTHIAVVKDGKLKVFGREEEWFRLRDGTHITKSFYLSYFDLPLDKNHIKSALNDKQKPIAKYDFLKWRGFEMVEVDGKEMKYWTDLSDEFADRQVREYTMDLICLSKIRSVIDFKEEQLKYAKDCLEQAKATEVYQRSQASTDEKTTW